MLFKFRIQKNAENIFKDKLDQLKLLRENIISLSPKTVSSRGDMIELPELDFANEDSYKIAEEKLIEKEREYQEKKEQERRENEMKKLQEMTEI